jgi:hypothetical protein
MDAASLLFSVQPAPTPGRAIRETAHHLKEALSEVGHKLEHGVETVAEKLVSPLRRADKPPPNDYSHQPRHATEEGMITIGQKTEVTATPDELPAWVHEPDVPLPKIERLELEEQEQKRAH